MDNEFLATAFTTGMFLMAVFGWARESFLTRREAARRGVVEARLAEILSRGDAAVFDDEVPEWGTQERKRWHAQQRDFHAAKVVEAGVAANQKESE